MDWTLLSGTAILSFHLFMVSVIHMQLSVRELIVP